MTGTNSEIAGSTLFNRAALEERVCGNAALIDHLLELAMSDFEATRPRLGLALATHDLAAAADEAHRMKGQFLTLGLEAAGAAAWELERNARNGDRPAAAAALSALDHQLVELREFFRNGT